jgi:hypothetical protein
MRDTERLTHNNIRKLSSGDHFGEISMIYRCPRTATVTCNDYCTFAVLPHENYGRLIAENPEFETELKKYVLSKYYDDPIKQWAFETLKQLPFLQDIEPENEWNLFHNIYYTMKKRFVP